MYSSNVKKSQKNVIFIYFKYLFYSELINIMSYFYPN